MVLAVLAAAGAQPPPPAPAAPKAPPPLVAPQPPGGALAAPKGAPGAPGAETVTVQMQFDNRGVKVARPATLQKIGQAVAECICNVPIAQVKYGGTLGQSLTNHQSVSTFTCTGPTTTRQPLLASCKKNTREGWIRSSTGARCIKKYTDTWAPGDAVDLQQATCT